MYVLKHCCKYFTYDIIMLEACSQDGNKAQGEAKCSTVFCIKHKQGKELNILKNFQTNTLIKMCFLVHCNLSGGSLFHTHELYDYVLKLMCSYFVIATLTSY